MAVVKWWCTTAEAQASWQWQTIAAIPEKQNTTPQGSKNLTETAGRYVAPPSSKEGEAEMTGDNTSAEKGRHQKERDEGDERWIVEVDGDAP